MPRPLWSRKAPKTKTPAAPKAAKVSPTPTAKFKNPTPAPNPVKPKVSPTPSAKFRKGGR